MNKLKRTILALTFLGRVKKDISPNSTKQSPDLCYDNATPLSPKLKQYNQILTHESNGVKTGFDQKSDDNDNGLMSPPFSIKANKVVPLNEIAELNNDGDHGEALLSLEKYEREVSLTESDSRYFKSESELDESPNGEERKINPSLFCIEEEDEACENKFEEKNFNSSIENKSDNRPKSLQQAQMSFHESEKEKMVESWRSNKIIEEEPLPERESTNESSSKVITKLRAEPRFKNHQFVLYPDDQIKRIWNIIMSILIIYVCMVMPYRVCFLEDDSMFNNLDYFTDACFYLDVIVNFVSVYHDVDDELVVENRKILCHYLSSWFPFDLVAVFPFDTIILSDKYNTLVRVARLPKLYRLIRITKLLRMVKLVKEKRKILNPLIRMGAGTQRLLISIISIIIFCHIACCFWYLTAIMDDGLDNWVDFNHYIDASNFELYIASFYWVTSTVVTVGYGDIYAVNTNERIMSIVLMFVGVIFYSFTIGSLSSLLSEFDAKNSIFDQKLNTLIQVKKRYGVDENLYLRIKKALKYGHLKTDQDKENFLSELPSNLRTELSFFMHKGIVSSIEFFKNRSERFIAFIGPLLKQIKIGKNEVIASQGDYANEMFFIKKGKVAIVIRQYNYFKFMTISQGYYFGEVDVLFGETRKFTFIAETDIELLSISKKQFTKIFFHEFISIGSELYKNALRRRVRNNKIYREALEYCKTRSEQEKNRKETKMQREFVINEEKYSRKISVSKDDLSLYEKCDSLTEKNENKDREIFENYEEEYVKSFKTRKNIKEFGKSKTVHDEIKNISEFQEESLVKEEKNDETSSKNKPRPSKLRNIISNLIQSKRTLKDEVNDLMTGTGKDKTREELKSSLTKVQKKISSLNVNFMNLLSRVKNSKEKLNNESLSKIESLLITGNNKNKPRISKKMSNDIDPIKKAVSIKLSNPITTLEKIIENEKLMSPNKNKLKNILRRKSTVETGILTRFSKNLNDSMEDSDSGNEGRKRRSKSVKKNLSNKELYSNK